VNDVCWINDAGLAIVMRPRGEDWLRADLSRLTGAGIQTLVSTLLQAGEKTGVHRRGCIARSTVVTVRTLVELGWPGERSLWAIGSSRGYSGPDTDEQREWITEFGAAE
jgi:hypothetical protein